MLQARAALLGKVVASSKVDIYNLKLDAESPAAQNHNDDFHEFFANAVGSVDARHGLSEQSWRRPLIE